MRILLHADVDVSEPGGVETHLRGLAQALEERGHRVEIAARPASFPPFRMVPPAAAAGREFDVVHHHIGAMPAALRDGGRYVRTLHLCAAAKVHAYLRIGRLKTLANPRNWREIAQERAACREDPPHRLVVVSERVRRELARHHGLDPAGAEVIPNGVDFAPPPETREAWRARHGIPPGAPVMLSIGREDFVKGHGLLEAAWRRSGAAERGAVWVTAGRSSPSVGPGRRVTGPIPHQEVRSWIGAADAGAVASYYEGCGLALLEMLAGGLFTLTHDVGIAPEVIRPGENGRIVPRSVAAWAEEIARALDRPPARLAGALDSALAWPRIAERLEAVYRRVLAEPM